jgi:hypothetical protein
LNIQTFIDNKVFSFYVLSFPFAVVGGEKAKGTKQRLLLPRPQKVIIEVTELDLDT